MVANGVGPMVRSLVTEETMLLGSLLMVASVSLAAAIVGGPFSGLMLSGAIGFGAAIGRLAFESIVQRDAPESNRGQAFARFETRFQVGWVVAGVIPVMIEMSGPVGFVFVTVLATAAAAVYLLGNRAVRRRLRRI
jgi:membrane protein implicated in regulation of membrane protease activity